MMLRTHLREIDEARLEQELRRQRGSANRDNATINEQERGQPTSKSIFLNIAAYQKRLRSGIGGHDTVHRPYPKQGTRNALLGARAAETAKSP